MGNNTKRRCQPRFLMTQNDPSYKQKQWLDSLSSLPTGLVQVYVTQVKAFVVLLPNTVSPLQSPLPLLPTRLFAEPQAILNPATVSSQDMLVNQMWHATRGQKGENSFHVASCWCPWAGTLALTLGVWGMLRKHPTQIPLSTEVWSSPRTFYFAFGIGILPIIFPKIHIKSQKIFITLNLGGSN